MKFQITYFLIKHDKKELIQIVAMSLCVNSFKEEEYDSGWNKILIDGENTMSGGYLKKHTMCGSFRMTSDIKKYETVFESYFDLNYFNKTCFTFLFYDDVFISVEIERIESE